MNFNKILYLSFISFICIEIFASCEAYVFMKDKSIPSDIKREIHNLNNSIVTSLVQKDSAALSSLTSSFFKSYTPVNATLFKTLQMVSTRGTKILNDFYYYGVKNTSMQLKAQNDKGEGYIVSKPLFHKKEFVSLVTNGDKNLLILVYGQENKKWKLDAIRINLYAIMGKNVYGWHERTKTTYQEGNMVQALWAACVTSGLLYPDRNMIYLKQNEIQKTITTVMQDFKKRLQSKIDRLPGKPIICKIWWSYQKNQYIPNVRYKTDLAMTDALAIEEECSQIHKSFWELHTGKEEMNHTTQYEVCKSEDQEGSDFKFIKR